MRRNPRRLPQRKRPPGRNAKDRLSRAWALLAILSGGVTLARAVHDRPASDAIAAAVRKAALEAAGATGN